jgi:hypothetical protein
MEAKGISMMNKMFLTQKRSITLENCKDYIQEFFPDDKKWFYDLCMTTDEEGNLTPFVDIKKKFYEKYFPNEETLTKRQKLFADWNV